MTRVHTGKRPPGRPPKQENQRQRILEETAKAIAKLGYERCALSDIAERVELTRPALYHYFTSKEEIFTEIAQTVTREMYEHVSANVSSVDSFARQLKSAMVAHAEYFDSRYWMNVAGSMGYGGIERRFIGNLVEVEYYRNEYAKLLARIIRGGIRTGEFRKVNAKRTIIAVYQLLNIMRWYRPEGKKSAVDFAVESYELLTLGLTARA